MKMSDKDYTIDDLLKMIYDLGVLLGDENGLIRQTLNKNYGEEYKEFDLMTAFDCMVDEVNRLNNVIELHDILAEANLERLLKGDVE